MLRLDVYKRQVEGNVTKVEEKSKLWIYLKNAYINKKAAGEGVIVQIPVSAHSNPVSYTHLDVYKRQLSKL